MQDMTVPCDAAAIPLCRTETRDAVPHSAVRPPHWVLATLLAACGPSADDDGDAGGDSSSTDAADSGSSAPSPDTSTANDSSGPVDPTPDDGSTGPDGTGTTGDETAADGCWDRSGFVDSRDGASNGVEPFVCPGLPMPCAAVELHFSGASDCGAGTYAFGDSTLADLAGTQAAARCVLQSMRDGEPAEHRIDLDPGSYDEVLARYVVLGAGVVTEVSQFTAGAGPVEQRLLAPRDAAWFDACLAAPDLDGLVPCLWPGGNPGLATSGATPCGDGPLGPVDVDACVGEDPACP